MSALPTPAAPDHLTPEWLTSALTETKVLSRGCVTAARWERIGQEFGFTGVVGRLRLRYDDESGSPPNSLVAKLPMARGEAVSAYRKSQERDPATVDRYYERSKREARFYTEIGAAFAPTLYYSAVDDAHRSVVLLLEDVSDGRQGNVLRGCSVDEARLVIDEIAPFHARWWGDCRPEIGFHPAATDDPRTRQERYARHVPHFLSEYSSLFPPELGRMVERLSSTLASVAAALNQRSQTLIHADLHLDNMIFEVNAEHRSVVVLDWQTVSLGAPAWDLVLFLVGSLCIDDRRRAETELLERYVSLLSEHDVSYSLEDVHHDYGLALLILLAGTVHWFSSLDLAEPTPRERALRDAALRDGRLLSALADHNATELLAGVATT